MAILPISDLKQLVQNTIYDNLDNEISGQDVQTAIINAIDTLNSLAGFVNVHKANGQTTITEYGSKAAARAAVPTDAHFEGVVIAYKLSTGWIIEQNLDATAGTWAANASWQTIGPVSASQNTLIVGGEATGIRQQIINVNDLNSVDGVPASAYESKYAARMGVTLASGLRIKGQIITYLLTDGKWYIDQFIGNVSDWAVSTENNWKSLAPIDVEQQTTTDTDGNGIIKLGGTELGKYAGADKLLKLVAFVTSQSALNVGDIYYNTNSKTIRRKTGASTYYTYPYYKGAIYQYNNNLYVWDGSDLVMVGRTSVELNNQTNHADIKSNGTVVGSVASTDDVICDKVSNNMNLNKILKELYIRPTLADASDLQNITLVKIYKGTLYGSTYRVGVAMVVGNNVKGINLYKTFSTQAEALAFCSDVFYDGGSDYGYVIDFDSIDDGESATFSEPIIVSDDVRNISNWSVLVSSKQNNAINTNIANSIGAEYKFNTSIPNNRALIANYLQSGSPLALHCSCEMVGASSDCSFAVLGYTDKNHTSSPVTIQTVYYSSDWDADIVCNLEQDFYDIFFTQRNEGGATSIETIITIKTKQTATPKIWLPEKIYALIGTTLQVFKGSIAPMVNPDVYQLSLENPDNSDCGVNRNRCYQYDVVSGKNDFRLKFILQNELAQYAQNGYSTITHVTKKSSPATQKNILCIGDSFTDADYWVSELRRLLTGVVTPDYSDSADSAIVSDSLTNLNFIGTRDTDKTPNEGYSGMHYGFFATDNFVAAGSLHNPFWDGTKVDFDWYCQQHGYSGIDYAIIMLGTNGYYDASYVQTVWDALLAHNPNIKVIICARCFANPYGAGIDGIRLNRTYLSLSSTVAYINNYFQSFCKRNAYKDNFLYVEYNALCDNFANMNFDNMPCNNRNNSVTFRSTTNPNDNLHPGIKMYWQIADAIRAGFHYWCLE